VSDWANSLYLLFSFAVSENVERSLPWANGSLEDVVDTDKLDGIFWTNQEVPIPQ